MTSLRVGYMIIRGFRGSITVNLAWVGIFTSHMCINLVQLADRAPSADCTTYGFVITSGSNSVPVYSRAIYSSLDYPILIILVPFDSEFFSLYRMGLRKNNSLSY